MTNTDGTDGIHSPKTHQHVADLMDPQSTIYIRLKEKTEGHKSRDNDIDVLEFNKSCHLSVYIVRCLRHFLKPCFSVCVANKVDDNPSDFPI